MLIRWGKFGSHLFLQLIYGRVLEAMPRNPNRIPLGTSYSGQSTVLWTLPEVPTGTPCGGMPNSAYGGRLAAETCPSYTLYMLNSSDIINFQYKARSPFD